MDYPLTGRAVKTKVLLACGAIAGPLFVAAFVLEGAVRAGYDPLRHPVSSLALGDRGRTQTANFLVSGLLTLALAAGLRRALGPGKGSTLGPLLVGVWAVGLLGAGIFRADPVSGYPPGTPDLPPKRTWHGTLHDLFALPGFLALMASCFVFARRFAARGERGWAAYSAVSGASVAGTLVLAGKGFGQAEGLVDLAGLFQRIAGVAGFGWLTVLAVGLLRGTSEL